MKTFAILLLSVLCIAGIWMVAAPQNFSASVLWNAENTEPVVYPRLAHEAEQVPVLQRKEPRTPPVGHMEYRNDFLWTQFFYPEVMIIKETKEEGSARTIVFRDEGSGYEFQIFAVPYAEDHITEERFRLDNPLGIVEEQVEFSIDGEKATAFYSKQTPMGETYEIWVISHGFLFEISTHKALKNFLNQAISTWQWL